MVTIVSRLGGIVVQKGVEVKIFYTESDELPAEVEGEKVLHLQPGKPYVWIVHPMYSEWFVSAVMEAGIVPVRVELEIGKRLLSLPVIPKQNGPLPEYTSEKGLGLGNGHRA